jgi:hypothetical protein
MSDKLFGVAVILASPLILLCLVVGLGVTLACGWKKRRHDLAQMGMTNAVRQRPGRP